MADDQDPSNDAGEEGETGDYDSNDANDVNDGNDFQATTIPPTTTQPPTPAVDEAVNPIGEDYDDEDLPEVRVDLIINEGGDGAGLPVTDLVTAAITDELGNTVTTTPFGDSINDWTSTITQVVTEGLEGNGTDISQKSWWGSWTWHKAVIVGLIALCVIGIILGLVCLVLGKKKKNKRSVQGATTTAAGGTGKGVTKSSSPKPEYSRVPTNV